MRLFLVNDRNTALDYKPEIVWVETTISNSADAHYTNPAFKPRHS